MADPTTPADRAALITMTEDDHAWCINLRNAQHAAFRLVVQYLEKATTELDAQRRALWVEQEVMRRLERYLETGHGRFWIDGYADEMQQELERLHADVRKEQGA